MKSLLLAYTCAVVAAVAFAVKAVVIASAGLGENSAEDVFFVLGLVATIVGAAGLGVWLARGQSAGMRVLGGFAGVVMVAAVTGVTALLVSAVEPDDPGWAWGELNLWVGAAFLLAAVIAVRRAAAPAEA